MGGGGDAFFIYGEKKESEAQNRGHVDECSTIHHRSFGLMDRHIDTYLLTLNPTEPMKFT